jgi:hypothetical protein
MVIMLFVENVENRFIKRHTSKQNIYWDKIRPIEIRLLLGKEEYTVGKVIDITDLITHRNETKEITTDSFIKFANISNDELVKGLNVIVEVIPDLYYANDEEQIESIFVLLNQYITLVEDRLKKK